MLNKSEQGKKNRRAGQLFEAKVRKELEAQDIIVSKWMNNVDLDADKLIPARSNRFNMRSTGFPDFIIFSKFTHRAIGLEVKSKGYLDKTERAKCDWMLKNKIFCEIIIAKKDEINRVILYDKYTKK
jgi:hypothetical protein